MTQPAIHFHETSSAVAHKLRGDTGIDPATWPAEWTEISFKCYDRLPWRRLPPPAFDSEMPLRDVLLARRSRRTLSGEPLAEQQLSTLLHASLANHPDDPTASRRPYPSGGARFPTECYVIAVNVTSLPGGVYHYDPSRNGLHLLAQRPLSDELERCFAVPWIVQARAILVLTTMLARTSCKYGDRGYRFGLIEAGHAAQNLALVGTALGIGITPVGGFADEPLRRLLGVFQGDELVAHTMVLP
jgi:SagB-type dehydrogenase family enzyme